MIDFEHINKYLKMKVGCSLCKRFDSRDDTDGLQEKAHRIGRHLLLDMALQNGKMAGVFCDMTCEHVEKAKREDDGFVILVGEGKTFKVSGAAGVFCSESEFEVLQKYISDARPTLHPTTEQVFCRRSGSRASVGEIGEFLKD